MPASRILRFLYDYFMRQQNLRYFPHFLLESGGKEQSGKNCLEFREANEYNPVRIHPASSYSLFNWYLSRDSL